jgi:hypothetical protein
MTDKAKKADYTEEEMKAFDKTLQQSGQFPPDSVFDPTAEARGEPRWRKNEEEASAPKSKKDAEE